MLMTSPIDCPAADNLAITGMTLVVSYVVWQLIRFMIEEFSTPERKRDDP